MGKKKIMEEALIEAEELERASIENATKMVVESFQPTFVSFFKDILSEVEDEEFVEDEPEELEEYVRDAGKSEDAGRDETDPSDATIDEGDHDDPSYIAPDPVKSDLKEPSEKIDGEISSTKNKDVEGDGQKPATEKIDGEINEEEEPEIEDDEEEIGDEEVGDEEGSDDELEISDELFDDEDDEIEPEEDPEMDSDEEEIEFTGEFDDEEDEEIDLDIEDDDEFESEEEFELDTDEDEFEEGLYIRKEGKFIKTSPAEALKARISELEQENSKLVAAYETLNGQLKETHLFNAKLAHLNKLYMSGMFRQLLQKDWMSATPSMKLRVYTM
jgi:hypothetical protein